MVSNHGSRDASDVVLGAYRTWPTSAIIPFSHKTISVPVGASVQASLNIGDYPFGYYLGVALDSPNQDQNIADNILAIGIPPSQAFLPYVLR